MGKSLKMQRRNSRTSVGSDLPWMLGYARRAAGMASSRTTIPPSRSRKHGSKPGRR